MTVNRVGIPQQVQGVVRALGDKVNVLDSKVVTHVHQPHILSGAGDPTTDETVPIGQLWVDSTSGALWSYTPTGWLPIATVVLESLTGLTLIRQSL